MNEEWERSENAPWNRNQSDELEERRRQENEQQEYFDYDDDLPDLDSGYDDEDDDDFFDEDDYLPPWPEWCDVCQGPCKQAEDDETEGLAPTTC